MAGVRHVRWTWWLFIAFCAVCVVVPVLALVAKFDLDQRHPCAQYGERIPVVSGKVVVFVPSCVKRQGM